MWYQSLVRSFGQEKNKIQAQQKKKMVKTSSSLENEPCCLKSCKKNTDSLNSKITQLTDKLSDRENMLYHYKLGLSQVEGTLVEHTDREIKYCEKIRGLELEVEFKTNSLECLAKELETLKKEKEGHAPTVESSPDEAQNRNPSVTTTEASPCTILPKPFIKFVKAADCTEVKTNKVEAARKSSVRYTEMYKRTSKSPNVRGNQRNWNNLKSQQLGNNFVMKKKACFNCGDFNHLAYDYGIGVKKGRTCLTNSHKTISPRPAIHRSYRSSMIPTRPNMNAAPRPNVNSARPQTTQDLMIILI
uniref:Ubiquitin hydrolase n=1 Tax=Tanacetum cinerariifolium TaxID=118510 RepID=A0A6L2LYL5_TANCI|nr:ubiquitin hydrolase [Tanacetum cinerariifolium]